MISNDYHLSWFGPGMTGRIAIGQRRGMLPRAAAVMSTYFGQWFCAQAARRGRPPRGPYPFVINY
jgi:hypothetical protein